MPESEPDPAEESYLSSLAERVRSLASSSLFYLLTCFVFSLQVEDG